jgi:hypothetical protein
MDCSMRVVLLWYEVRGKVIHRLQSMSYSGMMFVDKLHADYDPSIVYLVNKPHTGVRHGL